MHNLESQLAVAEAALREIEEKHGPDHIMVSHKLDEVARILRNQGGKTLEAANLEARAKVIRVKHNTTNGGGESRMQREISEAIRDASQRQAQLNRTRSMTTALFAVVVLVVIGFGARFVVSPTASERQTMDDLRKRVEAMLPASPLTTGQQAVKDLQDANKKHNDQLESFAAQQP